MTAMCAVGLARTASGQTRDTASERVAKFVAQTRAATERFKDVNIAIAERYVKVGPDFPAMGEHWVKVPSLMQSADSARPSILTYAMIDGRRTLTGVVYTIILPPGKHVPAPLVPGAEWHDHVGSVDEESLLFGHGGHDASDWPRLAVMHAWVWVPNSAGTFATDNWDLPFARLGLVRPAGASARASRAVALLTNASYYGRLFSAVGELDEGESNAVAAVIERARSSAEEWLHARKTGDPISTADLTRLEKLWGELVESVRKAVRPASAARLRAVLSQ